MRQVWAGLAVGVLVWGGPADAFVFIPMRAEIKPAWQAGLDDAAGPLASDLRGNVYLVQERAVRGFAAGTGRVLWTYEPPEEFRVRQLVRLGGPGVLCVSRADEAPAETLLTCLAPRDDQGRPAVRWQHKSLALPPGGVYVPCSGEPDQQAARRPVVVVAGEHLVLLDPATGEPLQRLVIDPIDGPIVWSGAWGFFPHRAANKVMVARFGPEPGQCELSRIDLPAELTQPRLVPDLQSSRLLVGDGTRLYSAPLAGDASTSALCGGLPAGGLTDEARVVLGQGWVYLASEGELRAWHNGDQQPRWRLAPEAGRRLTETIAAGPGRLVVVTRPTVGDGRATVLCLDGTTGDVRWRVSPAGVPARGVHLATDESGAPLGLLGVLSVDTLQVYDLASGQLRTSRKLGRFLGSPLWIDDSGFIATADGYQPEGQAGVPAVCGFDIRAAGSAGDESRDWVWRVPAGESLASLEWLTCGRLLAIRGRSSLYVFE